LNLVFLQPNPVVVPGKCSQGSPKMFRKCCHCLKGLGSTMPLSRGWSWGKFDDYHCINGLVYRKIYRKTPYLMVKTMVSCKISLKPIHWL
jgi:hypothetical protein